MTRAFGAAVRSIRRRPALAAIMTVTLALGLGANTTRSAQLDGAALALAAMGLSGVFLVAVCAAVPALRALRVDPVTALRAE